MFVKYLLAHHKNDITRILEADDVEKHYSVNISFMTLFDADANLGNSILKYPEPTLEECNNSIQAVQDIVKEESETNSNTYYKKPNVHSRIFELPRSPELHRNLIPGDRDFGSFLQMTGTVVRTTLPKMLEYQKQYMCTTCKYIITCPAEYEQGYITVPPRKCQNPEGCRKTTFIPVTGGTVFVKDYQELKIQEHLSKLGMGRMPNSIWVTMEDDLVDMCQPGDSITICGIVKRRFKPLIVGRPIRAESIFHANHILIHNDYSSRLITADVKDQFDQFWESHRDNPLSGRNIIIKSICSEIYGMDFVKLALAVVLAGGSRYSGSKSFHSQIRAEPHLLLVGDPGTGKSELLKFATQVIPRSVLTTGIGSTSAGLTATAVKEDGEWQLEGGALVMADGGICCIDEFNTMKKNDITSIHEAMEQQKISVAKAGVICELRTRCTVLAAMNPKSAFDVSQPFGMNINLGTPLLSRFDLVLHLKDKYDSEWDKMVADYVLYGPNEELTRQTDMWTVEMLQEYFVAIKKIHPALTPAASEILGNYFQAQRVISSRNKARTTGRLLDSLVRLSQGHARLMFHHEVQVLDAVMAVLLLEASLQGDSSLLGLEFDLNAQFPLKPQESYEELAHLLLNKLDLAHLLVDDSSNDDKPSSPNQRVDSHTVKWEIRTVDLTLSQDQLTCTSKGLNTTNSENLDVASVLQKQNEKETPTNVPLGNECNSSWLEQQKSVNVGSGCSLTQDTGNIFESVGKDDFDISFTFSENYIDSKRLKFDMSVNKNSCESKSNAQSTISNYVQNYKNLQDLNIAETIPDPIEGCRLPPKHASDAGIRSERKVFPDSQIRRSRIKSTFDRFKYKPKDLTHSNDNREYTAATEVDSKITEGTEENGSNADLLPRSKTKQSEEVGMFELLNNIPSATDLFNITGEDLEDCSMDQD